MKKMIRTMMILSMSALILGACGQTKEQPQPSSEPDSVAPEAPVEQFAMITGLEDAKVFQFDELGFVEDEELDEAYDAMFEEINKVEFVSYEGQYYGRSGYQEIYMDKEVATFYDGEYVEFDCHYTEKYLYLGTNMASWANDYDYEMRSINLGNGRVVSYYSDSDPKDTWTSWSSSSGWSGESIMREYTLYSGMYIYYLDYPSLVGKFVGEDGFTYYVLNDFYNTYSSNTNYLGETFYYLIQEYYQVILQVKDNRITQATYYNVEYVDHDMYTGALLEERFLLEDCLYKYAFTYGELSQTTRKNEFMSMIPSYGVCYTSNVSFGGYYYPVTLVGSSINAVGSGVTPSKSTSVSFSDPTHIVAGGDITFGTVTTNAIGYRPTLNATFSPLAEAGSNTTQTYDLVDKLAEALGTSAKVGSYNGAKYLILGNNVKKLSFELTFDFGDTSFASLTITKASIATN